MAEDAPRENEADGEGCDTRCIIGYSKGAQMVPTPVAKEGLGGRLWAAP